MSSNSRTKSRLTTIHSEGCDIINSYTVFKQNNSIGNLKFPTENATKHATVVMGKSEETIHKIRCHHNKQQHREISHLVKYVTPVRKESNLMTFIFV
jgi:hypothetical protein